MKNHRMAMEFDTNEIWVKLSDKPLIAYRIYDDTPLEKKQIHEFSLADFQKAMDRIMQQKRGK